MTEQELAGFWHAIDFHTQCTLIDTPKEAWSIHFPKEPGFYTVWDTKSNTFVPALAHADTFDGSNDLRQLTLVWTHECGDAEREIVKNIQTGYALYAKDVTIGKSMVRMYCPDEMSSIPMGTRPPGY